MGKIKIAIVIKVRDREDIRLIYVNEETLFKALDEAYECIVKDKDMVTFGISGAVRREDLICFYTEIQE